MQISPVLTVLSHLVLTPAEKSPPVFWAEWQAQQIIHRIQMYRHSVRAFCEEFNARYDDDVQERRTQGHSARKPETLIRLMAQYYNTTKLSARKRLIELGLPDAKGISNYVDDKPVPPFYFADGVLCKNQTFLISLRDAAAEFSKNEEFRNLIASSRYIYVEGRFCLNTPEYVQSENNGYRITDYGRMHTEECCLRFDITYREHRYQYAWGQFNREAAPADGGMLHFIRNAAELGLCDLEEMTHQALWSMDIRKAISGMEFGEALTYVMTARKMTIEQLEETSLISSRTIRRLWHSDSNPVKKEYIVAISVDMHLPPMVSMELLNVAGLRLTTSYRDNIYGMVLCSMYQHDIHTVNQYLKRIGIEPIGGIV